MTNLEIQERLKSLVLDERKITNEILSLINLAESRKIYLERGYGSLFDWLTTYFGYSESAAQRRIQAARLLKSAPEVALKMNSGELNLTTLSKAQTFIRQQEKVSSVKMTDTEKSRVVDAIENKSSKECEQTLVKMFPDAAKTIQQNRQTRIDSQTQRLSINLSDETLKELEEVKKLLSHAVPSGDVADVIKYLTKDFLKRKKAVKDRKSVITAAAAKQCVKREPLPQRVRRHVFGKANRQCEFVDRQTGQRCESDHFLEVDHIQPVALGGSNELENLRCLCRNHNQYMAEVLLRNQIITR